MELVPPTPDQLDNIFKDIKLNEEEHKRDTTALKEWLHSQPHLPHDLGVIKNEVIHVFKHYLYRIDIQTLVNSLKLCESSNSSNEEHNIIHSLKSLSFRPKITCMSKCAEEKMLYSFIVGCKNSLERSKSILDTYLTNRTTCPDFYQSRDPCDPEFRRLSKLVQYYVLPRMTPEGYRVSVIGMKSPDVSAVDFNLRMNAIKVLSSFDVRFLEEKYWAGDILVLDCKHFGMKHLQSVTNLPLLRKYIHCTNQSLPVRYKKLIFINLPPVAQPVISMTKMVLKQKFVQRTLTTAEDYPFLYNHIPQEILPNEYGGKAGKVEDLNDSWQLKVESYQDWFLKDMTRRVNESKRPEKSNSRAKQVPLNGIQGSFRTLTID